MSPLGKARPVRKTIEDARPVKVARTNDRGLLGGSASLMPRRVRRRFEKLAEMCPPLPRSSGVIAALGLVGGFGLYGSVLGGQFDQASDQVIESSAQMTASMGFSVSALHMSGLRETNESDVIAALTINPRSSLLFVNADVSRRRVAELPWVASASVQKLLPDQIKITIQERKPFAIWQRGQIVSIIDADGVPIIDHVPDRLASLPRIFGHGAPEHAPQMFTLLESFPAIESRVRLSEYVGHRRWNLHLENGVILMLPEGGELSAIMELARLDEANGLLNRDIAVVDLRLPDRLIVRLTPDAVLRRQAALRDQRGKRKGRRETDT